MGATADENPPAYVRWRRTLCFVAQLLQRWGEARPQPQGDRGGGQRAYRPSTAPRRTCRRTGAEAWRCCHSGDPCFSSATRRLCNPPARARVPNHSCSGDMTAHSLSEGKPTPRTEQLKTMNTPRPRVSVSKKEIMSGRQRSGTAMFSVVFRRRQNI